LRKNDPSGKQLRYGEINGADHGFEQERGEGFDL
jgi:hypothetical protein